MTRQPTRTDSPTQSMNCLVATVAVLLAFYTGCATATPIEDYPRPGRSGAHRFAFPDELTPSEDRVPETPVALIEAGLRHLDPAQPEGRDYSSAARLFLRAAEIADPNDEQDLRLASYRAAARAALRGGDRMVYARAVEGWVLASMPHELETGELAVHRAVRARLLGESVDLTVRVPGPIKNLIVKE